MARPNAVADATNSAAPTAMSRSLAPPGPDAPPAPVCGAPEGKALLVAGVVGVGVLDIDGDGLGDVLADTDALADMLAEVDGLTDDVVHGAGVDDVPAGAVALVLYVVAPAATETKMDWV
jgi:hypothetical protein